MESLSNLNFTGRMNTNSESTNNPPLTLVLGANGKTGRRVADRLAALGRPVRAGSRSAAIPFDWEDQSTWGAVVAGVEA